MARKYKKETQKLFSSVIILLRNSTWKCGKIERTVVNYLRNHIRRYGTSWSYIRDMIHHLKLNGKQKSEFLDAIKRLEKRNIIKINFIT